MNNFNDGNLSSGGPSQNDASRQNETAMCCAQFYEQDIVQQLMGGSFHPGGESLSQTLIQSLQLSAGSRVLDVACGVGTTTRMMTRRFGFDATGLDFSQLNVDKAIAAVAEPVLKVSAKNLFDEPPACCGPGESCCDSAEVAQVDLGQGNFPQTDLAQLSEAAREAGPSNQIRVRKDIDAVTVAPILQFLQGSADAIPFEDATFDGLTCECAVSTFADQEIVAREFFRVLKPGGMFGMTDMVLDGQLPEDFSKKAAPWTCVAKAMSVENYQRLFAEVGFKIVTQQDHSHTLLELAKDVKRKLVMASMGKALGALPSLGMTISQMRAMLAQSTELVNSGTIKYGLLIFRKP